jgi:hypothetical protein
MAEECGERMTDPLIPLARTSWKPPFRATDAIGPESGWTG